MRLIHPFFGFHSGVGGDQTGIGTFWRDLALASVPLVHMAADGFQLEPQLWAGSDPSIPHISIFRRSVVPHGAAPPPSGNPDLPDFSKSPATAARDHVSWHIANLPPELDRDHTWVCFINEPREDLAGTWLSEFHYEADLLARAEGVRHVMFNYSTGTPALETWSTPSTVHLLDYMESEYGRVALGLHEYSLRTDTIWSGGPDDPASGPGGSWTVGRAARVLEVIGRLRAIPIFLTEFGWTHNDVPPWSTAISHLHSVMQFYRNYPQVQAAAIWYLGAGYNGIAQQVQPWIAPLGAWTIAESYEAPDWPPAPTIPPPPPPPGGPHKAVVVKLPQEAAYMASDWSAAAEAVYPFRHTITASHDDMLTILRGGARSSFVKMVRPDLPSQRQAALMVQAAGYRWEELKIGGTPPPPPEPEPGPGDLDLARCFVPADGSRSPVFVLQNGRGDETTTTETCQLVREADGRTFFIKNDPHHWEEFRVRGGWIERFRDYSHGPDTFYTLGRPDGTPWSRWAPAAVGVGDLIQREALVSVYRKADCGQVGLPYVEATWLKIVSHVPASTRGQRAISLAGGSVIVAEFRAAPTAGFIERYYFAPGLYLIGWEHADRRWSWLDAIHPDRPAMSRIAGCQ